MSTIERTTITMPAAITKAAVEGGDYASTSEVIREALRDWPAKRAVHFHGVGGAKGQHRKGARQRRRRPDHRTGEDAFGETLALRLTYQSLWVGAPQDGKAL